MTGVIILLGRFLPIIGPVAIAGLLANKKYIPESAGTLKVDSMTFGIMTSSSSSLLRRCLIFRRGAGTDRGIF